MESVSIQKHLLCTEGGFASKACVGVGGAGTVGCRPQSLLSVGGDKAQVAGQCGAGPRGEQGTHSAEQPRSPGQSQQERASGGGLAMQAWESVLLGA